ncbi:MAG: hypothetical protein QOI67_1174, partial [Gaiellaceae bacterium]|nr:hypothetical protein [Gaiellaceae bacterium]
EKLALCERLQGAQDEEQPEQLEKAQRAPDLTIRGVREGRSRICFVQDPDGYRVELIDRSGK